MLVSSDELVLEELAKGKQQLMYTSMLKTASPEVWQRALFLAADRSQGGVLIHCAQGKDRTGVLAALLQHAVGDLENDIIASYALSETLLVNRPRSDEVKVELQVHCAQLDPRHSKLHVISQGSMDWSALRGSPPDAMIQTFNWIRVNYGAIDRFLERCHCDDKWREQMLFAQPALHGRAGWS